MVHITKWLAFKHEDCMATAGSSGSGKGSGVVVVAAIGGGVVGVVVAVACTSNIDSN